MKKTIMKVLFIILIICAVAALKLGIKIVANNSFIAKYPYDSKEYNLVINSVLNFYEPYVVHYNYGNYFYQKNMYEEAYDKYLKAMDYELPENKYCPVMINIALSLDKISENKDDDEVVELLEEAISYLKQCQDLNITVEDNNIKNQKAKATKIREDIENKIKALGETPSLDKNQPEPVKDALKKLEEERKKNDSDRTCSICEKSLEPGKKPTEENTARAGCDNCW